MASVSKPRRSHISLGGVTATCNHGAAARRYEKRFQRPNAASNKPKDPIGLNAPQFQGWRCVVNPDGCLFSFVRHAPTRMLSDTTQSVTRRRLPTTWNRNPGKKARAGKIQACDHGEQPHGPPPWLLASSTTRSKVHCVSRKVHAGAGPANFGLATLKNSRTHMNAMFLA